MVKEKAKNTWGGRREGAGRPRTDTKLYTFRVPASMANVIDEQPNKTEFIRRCINKAIEQRPDISRLGEVYAVTETQDISLPYFDVGIVAGFPLPLDNDERA